jgi:hypothetical protein
MERRRFLGVLGGAAATIWAGGLWAVGAQPAQQQGQQQGQQQTQQFPGDPMQPRSPSLDFPVTPQPELLPPKPDPVAILQHNQTEMQKDVARLSGLVEQLRKQVTKTDSTKVLSLDLIHTAEEIEKLAKQIKNLARA